MKRKELDTLSTISVEELRKRIAEAQKSLAQLKRERYTKQSKNTREGRSLRKNIAQMSTVLRQKELLA